MTDKIIDLFSKKPMTVEEAEATYSVEEALQDVMERLEDYKEIIIIVENHDEMLGYRTTYQLKSDMNLVLDRIKLDLLLS